jgi:iron complex transport system ATP-binding protein
MVVLECAGVSVHRGDHVLLRDLNLRIQTGEHWVVMGPNGAGKTTLLSLAAGRMFPTSGTVRVLDEELGAVDLAELRPRIGWASAVIVSDIPAHEATVDVVMTGAHAVTGRWRESYDTVDVDRAHGLLRTWGLANLAGRTFGTLSEGERKRALIARSLMADPEILLLDEPGAGLDLGGREELLAGLATLVDDPGAPTIVLVTHHVEEIPRGFTHALLLNGGLTQARGLIDSVMTSEQLTALFAMPLQVDAIDGRWFARRRDGSARA